MVAHIVLESALMVFGITIAGYFIGKLFKGRKRRLKGEIDMLAITMTQGWMIGIIAFMAVFGICAGVFSALGKKRK